MAIIVNGNQEEKEEGQGQQPAGPVDVSGGQSSTIQGTSSGAPSTGAGRKPAGSGRFTNIQKYIGAAGAGASGRLAGEIGKTVGQETRKLGEATQAAQGITPQLQAERDRIAQASGFAQQVQQDPTQLVQDPSKVQAFTQLRTGQTNIDPLRQQATSALDVAQNQLGKIQQLNQQAGTEGGRFELLRQSLGRPSYTRGQQRLDQLILQAGGGDVLGQLQKQTGEQARLGEQMVGSTREGLESGLSTAEQEAKTAQEQLLGALGRMDDPSTPDIDESKDAGALGALQQSLRDRQQSFVTDQEQLLAQIKAGKTNDRFSEDALKALGLKSGQKLYDVNLNELINPAFSAGNVTEQNVAKAEDVARYNALAQLAGLSPTYLSEQQAGTAPGLTVDTRNLQQALASAEKRYQDVVKASQPIYQQSLANSGIFGRSSNPADIAANIKRMQSQMESDMRQDTGMWDSSYRDAMYRNAINWMKNYYAMNPTRAVNVANSTFNVT